MANGSFCESCVGGKVLMEEKTVDVEVGQYPHQSVRWVKSVYLKAWSAERVGGGTLLQVEMWLVEMLRVVAGCQQHLR